METYTTKDEINRENLKANTLASVILRLDFTPVLDIKSFIEIAQKVLVPLEFKYSEGILKDIEVKINDPGESSNDVIFKKSINRENVYRFLNEKTLTTFSINRFFLSCEINCTAKYLFSQYITIFCKLIDNLKGNFEYLNVTRLGLRKINIVLCENMENVFNCFEKQYYGSYSSNINSELLMLENKDHFKYHNIGFNLIKQLNTGIAQIIDEKTSTITESNVIQVALDIDGYLKDNDVSAIINWESTIKDINNHIFTIYKSHLCLDFLSDLIKGTSNKVIGGVTLNA
ncbi:MAG: hypothetical protein H6Q69_205 [Firmicutes bacterium]|nr:hypothetical protein [Bacillota bacterium]